MAATITLNPTSGVKGASITIQGSGFKSQAKLRLLVDGVVDVPNSRFRASSTGSFTIGYYIPQNMVIGDHIVSIQTLTSGVWRLAVSATLKVIDAVTPPPPTPTIPTAPVGLKAVSGDKTVNLSWEVTPLATSYKIYRDNAVVGTSVTPSFVNTGLTNNQSYAFKVSAVNAVGEGPFSSTVNATPVAATSRYFPAPVTTATYNVPSSIDSTGVTDAASALNAWISTVPNGSVINFNIPGAIYRLNVTGIVLSRRNNLVFQGNGVELKQYGSPSIAEASIFCLKACNNITINNFKLTGNNPNTTTLFGGGENSHGVALSGWGGQPPSNYIEISNCTGGHYYGDFVYAEGANVAPGTPSRWVWIHHNNISYIGRMALASINVTDLLMEDNTFDKIGIDLWDIEPNMGTDQVVRNTVRNNVCGTYGHSDLWTGWILNANGLDCHPIISDIILTGNRVTRSVMGYNGDLHGIHVRCAEPGGQNDAAHGGNLGPRPKRYTITNNICTEPVTSHWGPGGVMYFLNIDGVTVTGNTQPLTPESTWGLARFDNCTGVVTS